MELSRYSYTRETNGDPVISCHTCSDRNGEIVPVAEVFGRVYEDVHQQLQTHEDDHHSGYNLAEIEARLDCIQERQDAIAAFTSPEFSKKQSLSETPTSPATAR